MIGGTVTVPYFWPYELWGYSLKFRPYIGLICMVGTVQVRFLKYPLKSCCFM